MVQEFTYQRSTPNPNPTTSNINANTGHLAISVFANKNEIFIWSHWHYFEYLFPNLFKSYNFPFLTFFFCSIYVASTLLRMAFFSFSLLIRIVLYSWKNKKNNGTLNIKKKTSTVFIFLWSQSKNRQLSNNSSIRNGVILRLF